MIKRKIVFLGSNRNPISVGCFTSLAATGKFDFLIGIDRRDQTPWQIIRQAWRRYGIGGAAIRACRQMVRRAGAWLRAGGPRDSGGASLRELASHYGTDCFDCRAVNGKETLHVISEFQPELIVVANFSQIIRSRLREIPRLGVINFHPSLLPKYRGPTPCYWIIKHGEQNSGVTIHYVDDRVDSGDIIKQLEFVLGPGETENSLINRAIEIGAPALTTAVIAVLAGNAVRRQQVEAESSLYGFPHASRPTVT